MREAMEYMLQEHPIILLVLAMSILVPLLLSLLAPLLAPRTIRRLLIDAGLHDDVAVDCRLLLSRGAMSISLSSVSYSAAIKNVVNQNSILMVLPSELHVMDVPELQVTVSLFSLIRHVLNVSPASPPHVDKDSLPPEQNDGDELGGVSLADQPHLPPDFAATRNAAAPAIEVCAPSARLRFIIPDHTVWASDEKRDEVIAQMLAAKEKTLAAHAAGCRALAAVELRKQRERADGATAAAAAAASGPAGGGAAAAAAVVGGGWPDCRGEAEASRGAAAEARGHVPSSATAASTFGARVRSSPLDRLLGWVRRTSGADMLASRLICALTVRLEHIDVEVACSHAEIASQFANVALRPYFVNTERQPIRAREVGATVDVRGEVSVHLSSKAGAYGDLKDKRGTEGGVRNDGVRHSGVGVESGAGMTPMKTLILKLKPAAATPEAPRLALGLHVRKRAPYTAKPGSLACTIHMGALEAALSPVQLQLLGNFRRIYQASCAWLAALLARVEAGEIECGIYNQRSEAAMVAALAELHALVIAAAHGQEDTSAPMPPGPPPPPIFAVTAPASREVLQRLIRTLPYELLLAMVTSATDAAVISGTAKKEGHCGGDHYRSQSHATSNTPVAPAASSDSSAPDVPAAPKAVGRRSEAEPVVAAEVSSHVSSTAASFTGVVSRGPIFHPSAPTCARRASTASISLPSCSTHAASQPTVDEASGSSGSGGNLALHSEVDQYGRRILPRSTTVSSQSTPVASPSRSAPTGGAMAPSAGMDEGCACDASGAAAVTPEATASPRTFSTRDVGIASHRGQLIRGAVDTELMRRLYVCIDVVEWRGRLSPSAEHTAAECIGSRLQFALDRSSAGSSRLHVGIADVALTDERPSTALSQRRVLGPHFMGEPRAGPPGFVPEESLMVRVDASTVGGRWKRCRVALARCALLVVGEMPALVASCCTPHGYSPDAELMIPSHVYHGEPTSAHAADDEAETAPRTPEHPLRRGRSPSRSGFTPVTSPEAQPEQEINAAYARAARTKNAPVRLPRRPGSSPPSPPAPQSSSAFPMGHTSSPVLPTPQHESAASFIGARPTTPTPLLPSLTSPAVLAATPRAYLDGSPTSPAGHRILRQHSAPHTPRGDLWSRVRAARSGLRSVEASPYLDLAPPSSPSKGHHTYCTAGAFDNDTFAAPAGVQPASREALHEASSRAGASLLLLGGSEMQLTISMQDVLLVLPPSRTVPPTSAPVSGGSTSPSPPEEAADLMTAAATVGLNGDRGLGTSATAAAATIEDSAGGWAVGLGLSGEISLDSSGGYERLHLSLRTRMDGSPLAPLVEAPLSWLQPARPLRVPTTPLLLPTELQLQYAAHAATSGDGLAGDAATAAADRAVCPQYHASPMGTPSRGSSSGSSGRLLRVERLVELQIGRLALEASPSQIGASYGLVIDALRRTRTRSLSKLAGKSKATSAAGSSAVPADAASFRRRSLHTHDDAPLGTAGGISSARLSPELGGSVNSSTSSSALPSSVASAGVSAGVSVSSGTWLTTPRAGSLRARHDLSHWTLKFIAKLAKMYKGCRRSQHESAKVHLRAEMRVVLQPITLRLRAEGSRGALSAPLVELRGSNLSLELSLHQKRSILSSVLSLYQLWDQDRLHAKASAELECESLNTKLGVLEPLVEPWRLQATVSKETGVRNPFFTLHASELHINISKVDLRRQSRYPAATVTLPAHLRSLATTHELTGFPYGFSFPSRRHRDWLRSSNLSSSSCPRAHNLFPMWHRLLPEPPSMAAP